MFRKVLIANRGEIAIRIARTCRDLGISPVGVYSEVDREAPFLDWMDEAYALGGRSASESYLSIASIISAARKAGVDAIHPGYGFLAENPDLSVACEEAGICWIGPSPRAISLMGDKAVSRRLAREAGVPLTEGTEPIRSLEQAREFTKHAGYPIAVKAVAGGGGRGLRVVRGGSELESALETASREGQMYFGNPEVYLERYLENPKHVEIQVMGLCSGKVLALGERDCSIQRRHQKLIEEAPGPTVTSRIREQMEGSAISLAERVGYEGAGTVEFMLAPDGSHYFLEMNTRIQVEHPVTELVRDCDLVEMQMLVAAGEDVPTAGSMHGHAIECRVNAEDVHNGFRPSSGLIIAYREPSGPGVRVDSSAREGHAIPAEYDSMIAKLIVQGRDREQARRRLLRALDEYRIEGVPTTIPASRWVLQHPEFVSGTAGTAFLSDKSERMLKEIPIGQPTVSAPEEQGTPRKATVEVNGRRFQVSVWGLENGVRAKADRPRKPALTGKAATGRGEDKLLGSPIQGAVLSVAVAEGEAVSRGDLVCVIEAMKMENEVSAHRDGTVTKLHIAPGQQVSTGSPLVEIE